MKKKKDMEIKDKLYFMDLKIDGNLARIQSIERKQKNFFNDLKVLFVFMSFQIVLIMLAIFTTNALAANILGYTILLLLLPILITIATMIKRM